MRTIPVGHRRHHCAVLSGAQNLNQMVNSTADRRAVCACFNQVGPSLGVNVDRAKKLPDLCKIDLGGITIDFTIDCSTIPV
ncbi:Non-specific lipid-transfer protein 2 [Camellia lanceoleosa]|uniref:Non-specific lipid-transfer protein 2 n=1 Tax=Camellia lanceoleosa TaxID=1840588 RepID=A0ACC0GLY4_9ERIC|nr:Non-specific lipid-transfer protein 2 [Camellia lanceoleosa]